MSFVRHIHISSVKIKLVFIRAKLSSIYYKNHFLREKMLQNFKIYRILSDLIVISCYKLLHIIVYLCVFVILGIKQIFISDVNYNFYNKPHYICSFWFMYA